MNLKASLLYAKTLVFPKSEKKSSARKSMFGSLVCIGLSVIPLIVVLTVSKGLISGMTERLIELSSSHISVLISRSSRKISSAQNFFAFADEIKKVDGVINSYPEVSLTALAGGKNERAGAQIRALPGDIFQTNKSFSSLFSVIEGDVNKFMEKEKKAIIGQKLAETLNLHAGDTFRIITTKNTNGKMSPRLSSFSVAAIVSSGYQELDALWVFVPIDVAYTSLSINSASFSLLVQTEDAFSPMLEKTRQDIFEVCAGEANVYTWSEMNASSLENFSSTRVMLVFIMILIVLVASVNISSAIVMLVMERRKEIAILKSVGASSEGITFSFLIAGLSCGLGGVILGLPIGLFISLNINELVSGVEKIVNWFARLINLLSRTPLEELNEIHLMDPAYYLSEIPIEIPFTQIFLIVLLTLILSFIVSIIPSRKAGKEKPMSLLQKS